MWSIFLHTSPVMQGWTCKPVVEMYGHEGMSSSYFDVIVDLRGLRAPHAWLMLGGSWVSGGNDKMSTMSVFQTHLTMEESGSWATHTHILSCLLPGGVIICDSVWCRSYCIKLIKFNVTLSFWYLTVPMHTCYTKILSDIRSVLK